MPALTTLPMDRQVRHFIQPKAITLRAPWTVDEAIRNLRANPTDTQVLYFYVLTPEDQLVGIVPSRKLLLSEPHLTLESIMDRSLIFLRDTDTLFDACELFAMHRLLAIPVVDANRRFLGTIDVSVYTDEVLDLAQKQASDEMFQLIGVHLEHARNASPLRAYKLRMPWLLCNIAGGIACAVLASLFDHVLQNVLLLALFIPIMLTLAESIAIQSMTLSIQTALAGTALRRGLFRELSIALALGLTSGLLVAATALAWRSPYVVPLVIGATITANMALSALWGNLIPKLIAKFHLNPTVASGPLVLALADTTSITVYLATATLVLT